MDYFPESNSYLLEGSGFPVSTKAYPVDSNFQPYANEGFFIEQNVGLHKEAFRTNVNIPNQAIKKRRRKKKRFILGGIFTFATASILAFVITAVALKRAKKKDEQLKINQILLDLENAQKEVSKSEETKEEIASLFEKRFKRFLSDSDMAQNEKEIREKVKNYFHQQKVSKKAVGYLLNEMRFVAGMATNMEELFQSFEKMIADEISLVKIEKKYEAQKDSMLSQHDRRILAEKELNELKNILGVESVASKMSFILNKCRNAANEVKRTIERGATQLSDSK